MKTLSLDLRERILASYDNLEGTRQEIAERYRVSLGMVKKLLQQRKRTGQIGARHAYSGRKALIVQAHEDQMRVLLAKKPDLTLKQLREALGLECSLPAIHYVLSDMGLTYKKRRSGLANRTARTSRGRAKAWRRRQLGFDPARLVFIDESNAKTNMTRLRGRALRGKRLYASAPQSHWHTTTMICAMRLDGSTACMTIEGATDTEVFQVFVRQVLCPTLRPGDLVIMDNLPPHKSTETLSLIQQLGAEVLFLPAYSPDLNPIEKMWSKLKEFLRSAEARSQASLTQAIASALETITAQDGINWFASCGYSFL